MIVAKPFADQVRDAYEHLYDLVYLRTHPLLDLLVNDRTPSRKDRAWRLHHILLNAIDELDPGPKAPTFSREWRRHRLMVLRYSDGLEVQVVSDQIAIGRRHYYREHDGAIEAIAQVLWDSYTDQTPETQMGSPTSLEQPSLTRVEMLRLEVARAAQAGRYADLSGVVEGLLPILRERLFERDMELCPKLFESLPRLAIERHVLRQLLLGLLGHFVERAESARIALTAQPEAEAVHVIVAVEPPEAVQPLVPHEDQDLFSRFVELAALGGLEIEPLVAHALVGVRLLLPVEPPRTVLVVDDNEDTIELIHRYLTAHHYRVAGTTSSLDAVDLAQRLQPQAITLDLMMPGRDGWDVLQMLLDHPDTQGIPIIVCSVLRQKELALSLGATAFLEKPITEKGLLTVLQAIDQN